MRSQFDRPVSVETDGIAFEDLMENLVLDVFRSNTRHEQRGISASRGLFCASIAAFIDYDTGVGGQRCTTAIAGTGRVPAPEVPFSTCVAFVTRCLSNLLFQ